LLHMTAAEPLISKADIYIIFYVI